ncbi:hypothetical protein R3P38DRAFT_3258493 [Favolaschia claudopus]|uniref:F-box domain-containing protein n=1 Tax=Favolaschia claudopus TaxID=2862362 RepID=A0AAW0D1F4_9AGAR
MSTPQDTVISSTELLELILSHLPMRDLLCIAPIVSKAWQATTTTPYLQRILFFEPDPSADPSTLIQNPLLAEIFSPFFTRLENPHAYHWPGRTASIWEMPWLKKLDAFRRAGASWRRMLVTQPPVQTLALKHVTSYRLGSTTRQATLSDLSLRMGFLFDLILPLSQDGDSTIHLRKSVGCMVDTRPVKRDTRFDSEEMKIVEIPFDPPFKEPVVWDDDDEKEFLMDIEKELELKRKRKEGWSFKKAARLDECSWPSSLWSNMTLLEVARPYSSLSSLELPYSLYTPRTVRHRLLKSLAPASILSVHPFYFCAVSPALPYSNGRSVQSQTHRDSKQEKWLRETPSASTAARPYPRYELDRMHNPPSVRRFAPISPQSSYADVAASSLSRSIRSRRLDDVICSLQCEPGMTERILAVPASIYATYPEGKRHQRTLLLRPRQI